MRNLLILLALTWCWHAQAQTFTVTPASGSGPRTATWDVPGGTNCQAGGDWSGAKAASGSQALTGLALGAHTFTLACSIPGSVPLSWVAPTQNVDGTALTNLAGFRIYYGTSASALTQTVNLLTDAGLTRYVVEPLSPSTYTFAITALNSAGVESDKSATVSKAVTNQSWTGTASTTVTAAKPKPPVLSFADQ